MMSYRCGDTEDGGNEERARYCGGVTISLNAHDPIGPLGYRCYDCKTVFCRACMPLHFTEEFRLVRAKLALATETMEAIRRMAGDPMKSWDSGRVIDAQRVEELCEDALERLR